MEITGTYTVQASPEEVWKSLVNRQTVLRAMPGIERLEQVDEHTYDLILRMKYAPLKGIYQGQATITEQHYPYHFRITLKGQEGRPNALHGESLISLNRRNNNTIIAYQGTLSISKPATLLPPLVVTGAAKLLIEQFFTSLTEQLAANNSRQFTSSSLMEEIEESASTNSKIDTIVVPPPTSERNATRPGFLRRAVHLLRLGGGDPLQEARWTQRIRRIGMASILLLLVWVGTRLPGRSGK